MMERVTADNSETIALKNLEASTIPLHGKHLIEASAGTGKTYNITRIYLRLLLERELTVEQILLMTFTKDATQELRGRIDAFIRQALNDWQSLCEDDPYFQALEQRIEKPQREFLLKRALLFLDEAAIFTIHGFCQRVLNQYAFTSGLPFNANMAANSTEVTLQVCQDWYRNLAKIDEENFTLLADFWPTPESYLSSFAKALSHTSALSVVDVESIGNEFNALVRQALPALTNNTALFENALILVKKGAEQEKRRQELAQLMTWLESIINAEFSLLDVGEGKHKMPDAFIDGKRYARSSYKAELLEVFAPVKTVKEQVKKLANNINKAKAYAIVKSGVYTIRQKVIEQKKALNLLDFDDLINTLADCLQGENSHLLANQLLTQYPVALIDEFQDTDPKQFGILQAIYYGEKAKQVDAGLFLIGDPKQAIYGFRGGDIFAYLNARSGCDYHWLMDTNWRSTAEMIAGYNKLFTHKDHREAQVNSLSTQESVFGFGIPYLPVFAGKSTKGQAITASSITDADKALQFIHFSDSNAAGEKVNQGTRPQLANWCANEIVRLLSLDDKHNAVKPKDIAILVRDGAEARDVKQALELAGLDSVFLSDRANLFHSVQAKQLLALLKGVLLPENERLFIAAISCGLLGFDASKLYQLQQDEIAYQSLKFAFVDYRAQWQRQGFITMAINLMHQHFNVPRLNKDRCITNILHLFEILQSASVRLSQGQELLHWFEQQCHLETNDVEAELRLESDGDLIRLITQHGSKGLEYPYVFIPFATRHKDPLKFGTKSVSYLEYHDQQGNLCLSLDGSKEAKQAMSNEAYAESIRLLYVAVTRAERRCYLLSCDFENYHLSPLGKTLKLAEQASLVEALQLLKSSAEEAIGITQVCLATAIEVANINNPSLNITQPLSTLASELKASKFNGNIERNWWLSSFSALSRNIRHAGISNPDRDLESQSLSIAAPAASDQIRFQLAKGAHTGNLLHDIFEHTDFTQPHWQESLQTPLLKFGDLNATTQTEFVEEDLITWLQQALDAPFIEATTEHQGGSLAQIPVERTLRESEFYFPMQGEGTKALAKLLTDHRNRVSNSSDILPVHLPDYKKLSGMMHGFIDLIFEYQGKYYLSDYKSSHLGDHFDDYQHSALHHNVQKNYYDLQYLIYSLALHRYLKQTLGDYDVEQHFGGVYYLYLRGMTNDNAHQGAGVYFSNITAQELNALEAVFSPDSNKNKLFEGEQSHV